MGGFDDYVQLSRDNVEKEMHTAEKMKTQLVNLGEEHKYMDDQDLVNKYESRVMENSTFEERTRYYFEDKEMLDAKVQRYRSIANNKAHLDSFADRYSNKSGYKRKKAAKNAANSFEKAAKLQEKMKTKNLKGFALYQEREKILRLRMEGMVYAATLKSYSASDLKYRESKARLSCLIILKDQLENLHADADKDDDEKFFAEREKIEKELEGVKKELRTRTQTAQSKWENKKGFNDRIYNTELEKEKKKPNKYAVTMETVKAKLAFEKLLGENSMVGTGNNQEPMFFGYVVKLDGNGIPINDVEKKKAEWNEKLENTLVKKENETEHEESVRIQLRYDLVIESLKRFDAFKLPTPKEIEKKGICYFFNQDSAEYYNIMRIAGKYYELESREDKYEYIIDFVNKRPGLKKKFDVVKKLNKLFMEESGIKLVHESKKENETSKKLLMREYTSLYNEMYEQKKTGRDEIWNEERDDILDRDYKMKEKFPHIQENADDEEELEENEVNEEKDVNVIVNEEKDVNVIKNKDGMVLQNAKFDDFRKFAESLKESDDYADFVEAMERLTESLEQKVSKDFYSDEEEQSRIKEFIADRIEEMRRVVITYQNNDNIPEENREKFREMDSYYLNERFAIGERIESFISLAAGKKNAKKYTLLDIIKYGKSDDQVED